MLSLSSFIKSISSYDSNIMLAIVISLLVVILFVLLLHIYAKWFLAQTRRGRRSSSVSVVSHVLRPSRFHHFHAFTLDATLSSPPTKGLDPSLISSIPLFLYSAQEHGQGLECVICLSVFEENEVGRSFAKCGHGFHVECIDMWLHSHSNCPICRTPAATVGDINAIDVDADSRVEIVIDVSDSDENVNHRTVVVNFDSLSSSSSSTSSSPTLGCSLKRMLSRSRSEHKCFPAINNDVKMSVGIAQSP